MLLPYPVSANLYWRNVHGRMIRSKEATAYKQVAALTAKACGVKLSNNPVEIHVKLHPKATKAGLASRTCIDLDNSLKVAIDALNGVAYVDDKQVVKIVAEIANPLTDGGLTVMVYDLLKQLEDV